VSAHVISPLVYLVRHGQTAWSLSGQHTGRTDIPLTPDGDMAAKKLGDRLRGVAFAQVLTSPLIRAKRTCELSGYGPQAMIENDLMEWDYGHYEGRTTADIKRDNPAWDLFREGCPGGETPAAIAARADRVIARIRQHTGPVLLFSSGHILRVLTARWCGLDVTLARFLLLGTGSISVLGYDHHSLVEPAIQSWNQTG
jgi:broad specificity phosphatase PhoE